MDNFEWKREEIREKKPEYAANEFFVQELGCTHNNDFDIVTCRPVAGQWLGKHVPAETHSR
jgi:hypothetical protein